METSAASASLENRWQLLTQRLKRRKNVIPGFGLSMGFTVFYLSLLVLIPLSMLLIKTASFTWGEFWATISEVRTLAAFRLSLTTAFIAAAINVSFGLLAAWVLVRYNFPGRRIIDGLIDLPFALPTAVAGISLTALYAPNGFIGQFLGSIGIKSAYSELGIIIALTFIGLPFVVRTVQPVLEELDVNMEEAAASLGASRWQTFWRVLLPELIPALVTGFTLAFARGIGEYGSVIFIAGNMPMRTEITPLLIMIKLEQYDYAGATAIAFTFLMIAFLLLFCINFIERRTAKAFIGR